MCIVNGLDGRVFRAVEDGARGLKKIGRQERDIWPAHQPERHGGVQNWSAPCPTTRAKTAQQPPQNSKHLGRAAWNHMYNPFWRVNHNHNVLLLLPESLGDSISCDLNQTYKVAASQCLGPLRRIPGYICSKKTTWFDACMASRPRNNFFCLIPTSLGLTDVRKVAGDNMEVEVRHTVPRHAASNVRTAKHPEHASNIKILMVR